MDGCPIRVLHVEDDRIQRSLVAHYLDAIKGHRFVVIGVESEDQAVDLFRRGGIDLVILDYQLVQGDGLHCLQQLRRIDPLVPVIAVSGIATQEIAAKLIGAGADDYLDKQSMDKRGLAQSVVSALTRARAVRARLAAIAVHASD